MGTVAHRISNRLGNLKRVAGSAIIKRAERHDQRIGRDRTMIPATIVACPWPAVLESRNDAVDWSKKEAVD